MKMKTAKIIWHDACDHGKAWVKQDELSGLVSITTVGMLINKTKDMLTIAHSICEDGDLSGVFYIPRGCVKSIEYLKVVKRL